MADAPIAVATQLSTAYTVLMQASLEAELCTEVCRGIAATACELSPILCKLLAVGHLFPADHQDLNKALHRCLSRTVRALYEAANLMYEYLQKSWAGKLAAGRTTKERLLSKRDYLNARFHSINTFVTFATYLQVRQGIHTIVPAVEAVERLSRELESLENIPKADSDRIQTLAAVAVKRKTERGKKIEIEVDNEDGISVALSPDGNMFATCTWDSGDLVQVWEVDTGRYLYSVYPKKTAEDVSALAWSPDSKMLAVHDAKGPIIRLWKVSERKRTLDKAIHPSNIPWDESSEYEVLQVAWSPDASHLAVIYDFHRKNGAEYDPPKSILALLNVASGNYVEASMQQPYIVASCVAWSPYGKLLATGGQSLTLWSAQTCELERQLQLSSTQIRDDHRYDDSSDDSDDSSEDFHECCANAIAFSPDGERIVAGYSDGYSRLWNVAEGTYTLLKAERLCSVEYVAWSQDGEVMMTADVDEVVLWDAATLKPTRVIRMTTIFGSEVMIGELKLSACGTLLFCVLRKKGMLKISFHVQLRVFRVDGFRVEERP